MASKVLFGRCSPAWGYFVDENTQTVQSVTEAYAVKLGLTEYSFGCGILENGVGDFTRITAFRPAVYNIQFSLQLANAGGQLERVNVWLSKNSSAVDNTNTLITVPYSHAGDPGNAVAAWNFVLHLDSNDYVELMWSASSVDVSMPFFGVQSNPYRPKTPSAIVSVTSI